MHEMHCRPAWNWAQMHFFSPALSLYLILFLFCFVFQSTLCSFFCGGGGVDFFWLLWNNDCCSRFNSSAFKEEGISWFYRPYLFFLSWAPHIVHFILLFIFSSIRGYNNKLVTDDFVLRNDEKQRLSMKINKTHTKTQLITNNALNKTMIFPELWISCLRDYV